MKEIFPNLFIGNQNDYDSKIQHEPGWCVVHACKEPYHRRALGYKKLGAPQDHPEYLIARRENRLILNLVDADDPAYIRKEIIDAALDFISTSLASGSRVLVHCNEGCSRSASIGLLYLVMNTDELPKEEFLKAEVAFRLIYPQYNPKNGMRGFMMSNWRDYTKNGS